jgi:hypothetical protein
MQKLIGILFLLAGTYVLGQNVIFSTYFSPFFWGNLPAVGSVLSLMIGIICLVIFPRQTKSFGWIFPVAGIVSVFLRSGVSLKPTSLWNFVLAFTALTVGYRLLTARSLRF